MPSIKRAPAKAPRLRIALVLVAVGVLAACENRGEPAGTLVVALEAMPRNLDPRFATDAASTRIGNLVFRSLTRPDRNGQRRPDLALDWTLDDSRTVTFRLRRDAVFHDGRPLTAADVRATYQSILDPATGSPKRALLEFLEGVDAPDDFTVRFRMKEPFAPFLEATTIGILPADGLRGESPRPIGSGTFRLAAIERGHEVRLAAVEGHPGLREIRFRVIPDDTVRALEMRKGTVHLVQNGVEPEALDWLARRDGICVSRTPGTTFQYVGLNARDPALSDVRVRRALAHAIDHEALVTHLLKGTARPATGLLPPSHWAYEGDVARYPHDPEGARRLLDEAGYTDPDGTGPEPRLRLTYRTTTLASRRRLAEALQAMLGEVGVAIEIRSHEWATFYDDIRHGSFQLYGLAWVGISDPDIYFDILSSTRFPPRGNNRGHFSDPVIDRLTRRGRRTLDPARRQEIYADVQRRVSELLPFLPLWWEDVVVVRDRRLCGFVPSPSGEFDSLRTAWWNPSPPAGDGGGPCACNAAGERR